MRTLLDSVVKTPAKQTRSPALSRSGIPMKELNRFAKELAKSRALSNRVFEKMTKAGYVPT